MQNSRGIKIGISVAVVLLVGGLTTWKVLASRQPKLDASVDKLRSFVASDKFKELPADQQKQYADAMFNKGPIVVHNGNPSDESEKAILNAAMAHKQAMLDAYFALSEGKARKDYLDKQIDQQEQIKKLMENPPATQPGDGQRVMIKRSFGGSSAAAQKSMAETVPPDQQAKMAQYMHDMQARRAERGLPAGPGGFMMIRTNSSSGPH
jgi:hypothetical protein